VHAVVRVHISATTFIEFINFICVNLAKMCLTAGLRRDPLGELTALPILPSWNLWGGTGKERIEEGRGREGERKEEKGRGRGRKGCGTHPSKKLVMGLKPAW